MDRFSHDDGKKQLNYQGALEFIGEVRAGISWERFHIHAVHCADALIDMMNHDGGAREFLTRRGIGNEYVRENVGNILDRLHFNRENDHYLALLLPPDSSESQIHKRWKELMLLYHPDKNGTEQAARCAKRINEAYNVLKNPEKKKEYDRKKALFAADYQPYQYRKKHSRSADAGNFFRVSERMRKLLPRLIIPCSAAVSLLVLAAIFLQNKPWVSTPDTIANFTTANLREVDERSGLQGKERMDISEKENTGRTDGNAGESRKPSIPIAEKQYHMNKKDNDRSFIQLSGIFPRREDASKIPEVSDKVVFRDKAIERRPEVSSLDTMQKENLAKNGETALSFNNMSVGKQDRAADTEGAKLARLLMADEDRWSLENEALRFIARYISAYREGEIDRFISLYSASAVENNTLSYNDIRRAYQKNFERNRYEYALTNIRFHRGGAGDQGIIVTGEYSIKKLKGAEKGAVTSGNIRWMLRKEGESIKIARVDYD